MITHHPAHEFHSETKPFSQPDRQPPAGYPLNNPVVLIVDHRAVVRYALRRELELHGFDVLIAVGGWEALAVYEQHRDAIAAVLMEVDMPGLDGHQTLRRLQQLDPKVPVCFLDDAGGDPEDTVVYSADAVCVFNRPFRMADVAGMLWRIVQGAAPPGLSDS